MARKYEVKITSSGLIYILITIVLSVAAINTGNNLLYIISSLLLALMAISGLYPIRSGRIEFLGKDIHASPSPHRLHGTESGSRGQTVVSPNDCS
jgi:disulfide bond formation protein DsbB